MQQFTTMRRNTLSASIIPDFPAFGGVARFSPHDALGKPALERRLCTVVPLR